MSGYGCTYGRGTVAHCIHSILFQPTYFWSRYPLETTKLWNLKNLLTPTSWLAYFISITFIVLFFKLSCYVGRELGLSTVTEEIALVPTRCSLKTYAIIFSNI